MLIRTNDSFSRWEKEMGGRFLRKIDHGFLSPNKEMNIIDYVKYNCINFCKADSLIQRYGVDYRDDRNKTALHWAAGSLGSLSDLKYLIKKGADVNARDYNDSTPLHEAVRSGDKSCIEYLVDN